MPTSLYNFQYVPLTGRLPGKSFVSQTEQAINGLAQYVYENSTNYEAVKAIAQKAEEDSSSALEYSEEALDKAQTALETVGRAYIKTTSAVDLDDYFDSELLLILSTESTNLPANISGYLTVMSSDTHDYCMQVYIGIDGSVYKRTATISNNTPTFGAWSETPITLSSLQTILANYTTVDASNIGINAESDNSTLWGNAIGGGEIVSGEQRLVTGDTVYKSEYQLEQKVETDIGVNDKRITNIEKLLQGNLYDYQTDSTSAYTKSVPSGAMPYAGLEQIGGKTLVMNQLFSPLQRTYNGVTQTFDSQTGLISLSGAVTSTYFTNAFDIQFINGHKYCGILTVVSNPNNINFKISSINLGGALALTPSAPKVITTANQTKMSSIGLEYYGGAGVDFTGVSFKVVFSDITLMFGAGNEPSTVEEFEAIFPANFYSVNGGTLLSAGVTEVVSKGKNLINEANVYSFTKMQYEGGVFTNTATDNKTTFSLVLQYFENGSYIGNVANQQPTTIGINTVTFTATVSCNQLSVGHNGSAQDLKVAFYADIVAGKTYTLSINVISNIANQVGGIKFNDVMLEESATATNYVPYMTPIQYPIPAEVQSLDGYGWSAGSLYNYIDYERKVFVQRVAKLSLAIADMNNSESYPGWKDVGIRDIVGSGINSKIFDSLNKLCNQKAISINTEGSTDTVFLPTESYNGMTQSQWKAQYPDLVLDIYFTMYGNNIETDISAYLTDDNLINVEAGGTLTFEKNQHGDDYRLPVPSDETYMIDLQEAINNG